MEYTIEDVKQEIIKTLNKPLAKVGRDIIAAGVSIADPVVGVGAAGVNSFISAMDEYLFNRLIYGLSSDKNQETQINELFRYVKSSPNRAFIVGSIFKQTLISKSEKTCVLYGKILSDHIGDKESDFSREELIVCNALIDANDYDLTNFMTLMKKYVVQMNGIKRISINENDDALKKELLETCSWCTYNRLFSFNPTEWFSYDDGNMLVDTHYRVLNTAEILEKWINEIKQII